MKVFKLKEDYTPLYSSDISKGRLLVKVGYEVVVLATPTLETMFVSNSIISTLSQKGIIEEVNLEDEKWVHPHICKKVREIFG